MSPEAIALLAVVCFAGGLLVYYLLDPTQRKDK